mmetsp:Transcript_51488/g.122443  ORF Transcript_51488/g.122443 Transcript_51488/m.122443 type:complete len:449 (-) Transcript_51488:267-1613(-)
MCFGASASKMNTPQQRVNVSKSLEAALHHAGEAVILPLAPTTPKASQGYHEGPVAGRTQRQPPKRAAEALAKGIPKLRGLIAELPAVHRRDTLQGMRQDVRQKLLAYMEAEKKQKAAQQAVKLEGQSQLGPGAAQESPSVGGAASLETSSNSTVDRVCSNSGIKRRRNSAQSQPPDNCVLKRQRQRGGVCMMRSHGGPRYVARLVAAGIAINSVCLRSRKEAQEVLAGLQLVAEACDGNQEKLIHAIGEHQAQNAGAVTHGLADLRFRATVDARRWVNSTLSSHQVDGIEEAVAIHKRLAAAKDQGWAALRQEWVHCMLQKTSTSFGRRIPDLEAAEKRAAAVEGKGPRCTRRKKTVSAGGNSQPRDRQQMIRAQFSMKAKVANMVRQRVNRSQAKQDRKVEREDRAVQRLKQRIERVLQRLCKALDVIAAKNAAKTKYVQQPAPKLR